MPELPEVETTRRNLERALKGKRLVEVVVDRLDDIVFDRASPLQVTRALKGARVIGSGRKGKYFWLELDRGLWPVIHLGMTGNISIFPGKNSKQGHWGGNKLWSQKFRTLEPETAPRFCRLRLVAEDGTIAVLSDPRRFGRVRLAADPLNEKPISELGFDPLLDFPSASKLGEILAKRRAPIKAVLLDQGLFAGVGNWIADEVLFQARLSPRRLASALKPAEVARLRLKLLAIIRKAVSVRADSGEFPRSWLFHHRWGKKLGAVTSHQLRIVHETIGGRTTAWVPEIQK